jgi:hypothetical protein
MDREGDNQSAASGQISQPGNASRFHPENEKRVGNDQHHHFDDMDQVEGRMHNGEIGSGITKQDEDREKKE